MTPGRIRGPLGVAALAAAFWSPADVAAQWMDLPVPGRPAADAALVEAGRAVYETHCWYCHGEEGDGAGPVAAMLWPRPRDFTIASFKLRTTGSGELPTDQDLYRSITLGLPGTAMPAWGEVLGQEERWQVIAYLKTFAGGLFEDPAFDPYGAIVELAPPPDAPIEELVARGREVYEGSDCWECHGDAGRGDGPKAPELRDDWGYPNRASDLESGAMYRGGSTPRDVYVRLSTGLDGTPMPSYVESLSDEERWQVAHYVASLDLEDSRVRSRSVTISAGRVRGSVPSAPEDAAWNATEEVWIPITGQATFAPRWQIPSVTELSVRALYDEDELAIRLSWSDRSADTLPGEPEIARAEGWSSQETFPAVYPEGRRVRGTFADAVEAIFPAHDGSSLVQPHFVYGDADAPVEIWRWSAATPASADLGAGVSAGVARAGTSVARMRGSASELTARGTAGPPEPREAERRRLRAAGTFAAGRWSVVLTRPLRTDEGPLGGNLRPGRAIPIAFHVRDGGHGETGLRMALSQWHFLFLEEPRRPLDYLLVLLVIAATGGAEALAIRALRRRVAVRGLEGREDVT